MAKTPSFRHGLPESSAMDGNLSVHKCLIKHDWQILVSRPCDWMQSEHPCSSPFGQQSFANRLSCRFVLLPGRNYGLRVNSLPHNENRWPIGTLDRNGSCQKNGARRVVTGLSTFIVCRLSKQHKIFQTRHVGMDANIHRPWTANQPKAHWVVYRPSFSLTKYEYYGQN